MERRIFNPFSKVKLSPDVAKKLEVTPKETNSTNWLMSLRRKQVYAGTANPKKVAKRRAKNKVASHSRAKNRR